MNRRVYIETTVISYLAARASRDVIIKAHQEVTHAWWLKRRKDFEPMVSDVVIEELGRGDKTAAARRLAYARNLDVVLSGESAIFLARLLLKKRAVPVVAEVDALPHWRGGGERRGFSVALELPSHRQRRDARQDWRGMPRSRV